MRAFLALLLLFATISVACADGGAILFQEEANGLRATLFSSPAKPVAGPADLSVFIEDLESGEPVLDATVQVQLEPVKILKDGETWVPPCCSMGGDDPIEGIRASRAESKNKLLYSAKPQIREPGFWLVNISIDHGGTTARVSGSLEVRPARNPWVAYWPTLAIVPIAILGFGLHQRLKRVGLETTPKGAGAETG